MLTVGLIWVTLSGFFLLRLRRAEPRPAPGPVGISVIIPMRNEAANAAACIAGVQAACGPQDEIIVVDDQSTDGTGAILRSLGVVPLEGTPLPPGWLGKQWACLNGARTAKNPVLLFVDADVRLATHAVRMAAGACSGDDAWWSEFPRQEMPTPGEKLGLGPLFAARFATGLPADRYRAACGQLFAIRRDAYEAVGGHEAVRDQVSEDVALARVLAGKGFFGKIQFGTGASVTRMYSGGVRDVWNGWVKNLSAGAAASPAGSLAVAVWLITMFSGPFFLTYQLIAGNPEGIYWGVAFTYWAAWGFAETVRPFFHLRFWWYPFYLLPVLFFIAAFFRSLLIRMGKGTAVWKGRAVP